MRAAGAAWTGGPTDEEKCVAGATWKGHRVVLDGCDVLCQIGNGHQSIGGIYCIYIYIYPLYIPSFDHGTYGMP